ncbi:hypothetical protein HQN90_35275 [Paenibacillus alba]|uniref:hypothetical protein n=1 Tax=Paenibacillus alba TaxID=1197127 RepID=UPI001565033C|nr:hypothetical protein [Paenibacillus alba]NQX71359.1 hypothetical protein [Paenibacillus alba]
MGIFDFNMDFEQRDRLLDISGEWIAKRGSGSIRRFEFIDFNTLKELIENKYINPLESHNTSPTIAKIYNEGRFCCILC